MASRRAAGHERAVGRLARRGHGRGQQRCAAAHGTRRHCQPLARHGPHRALCRPEHCTGAAAGTLFLPDARCCQMLPSAAKFIDMQMYMYSPQFIGSAMVLQVAAIPFLWAAFSRTPQGRDPLYSAFCNGHGDAQRRDTPKAQPADVDTGRVPQQLHRGRHTALKYCGAHGGCCISLTCWSCNTCCPWQCSLQCAKKLARKVCLSLHAGMSHAVAQQLVWEVLRSVQGIEPEPAMPLVQAGLDSLGSLQTCRHACSAFWKRQDSAREATVHTR